LQVLDFRDQIHRLLMPTLWLWGRDDAIVPSTIADAVRQLQPASYQQQVVAGHLLFLSSGDEVAAKIIHFIEGKEGD
jgi:pimeloyl-ACP methyl ester carboxylesterase